MANIYKKKVAKGFTPENVKSVVTFGTGYFTPNIRTLHRNNPQSLSSTFTLTRTSEDSPALKAKPVESDTKVATRLQKYTKSHRRRQPP
jgi:hypothetical protein